ncbi:MAG: HD domain-containing protein [Chloroflexi bacterium]|nr:HD domain-containing protein [Chloroflexota bacterium]
MTHPDPVNPHGQPEASAPPSANPEVEEPAPPLPKEPDGRPAGTDSALLGLARHGYLFARAPYSIRDAVYGSIPLSAAAYATLNTPLYQRLKHIKQIGPVYLVYPGATHTRFSHGIGVYHLARLALQHLTALVDFPPEVGRATLAAALLHDLGHFPFSHLMDELEVGGQRLSHADLSVHLVLTDAELGRVLAGQWEVDRRMVAALIGGQPYPGVPRFLNTLLDGPMDLDKLDYLNRDAHHAGVPYGRVEVQRLIDFLAVDPDTEDLVVTESGIGTVESVIFAKYLMFRYVYWHHTARIASAMINRAVLDALLAAGLTDLDVTHPELLRLCLATDATMPAALREVVAQAGAEPPPSFHLLQRVEDRQLYKRAVALSCADAPEKDQEYTDALARRAKEQELAAALAQRIGGPVPESTVLIDVPRRGKFAADVRGIVVPEAEGRVRVVGWEDAPLRTYFTRETVTAMENRIRTVLYIGDPQHWAWPALRQILQEHPDLL